MIISFEDTCKLLEEQSSLTQSLALIDKSSTNTQFANHRPQGFVIEDSYNNIIFPIPRPQLDTAKCDLPEIYDRFQAMYSKFKLKNLPWHFVIEVVQGDYVIFNTRPIHLKYPFTNRQLEIDVSVPVDECIHILIIGDTNTDIYTTQCYRLVGERCIAPFAKIMRKSPIIDKNVIGLNLGKKFNIRILESFIKR